MSEAQAGAAPAHARKIRSFLQRFRTEILAIWRRMARDIPATKDLPSTSLVDHLPELLDEIASVAEQLLDERRVAMPDAARRHAVDRLRAGFDVFAVVHELSLLRRCILTVWNREHRTTGDEIVALNIALDRAVAASVGRYAEARERTLTIEVSELRRAREALRLSEARLQSILEHSPTAIFVLDDQRRLVLANRQTAAVLGHPGEDVIGRSATELLPPEVEAEHRTADEIVLRENRPITTEEEVPSPDGPRTFLSVKFPIPGDAGPLVCGIATDITDRKRIEEELRRAIAARDEVLAIVSHDLRNPLSAIQISAMLLGDLGLDARASQHLEMIQRATRSMGHLIDDLLDTASIDAGKLALHIRREPVTPMMTELRDVHEPLAREHRIELHVACDAPGVDVLCDRDRVRQVFGNLVSNAFKFCRAGDAVSIACQPAGDHVEFWVADTGPGIDPALVPHLFDPYWSAPQQAKRGFGLGLYIAKAIVERHGGRIWVEARRGAGTTFSFTLPAAR